MQYARLNCTNAHTQQIVSTFVASGHEIYSKRIIAFAISAIIDNKVSWPMLINLFDLIITTERNVFKKSLVLNGIVNFCIANGDGFTLRHHLCNQMLGVLIEKYY